MGSAGLISMVSPTVSAITIAYIDSGVSPSLAATEPRLLLGYDYVNDDNEADDISDLQTGTSTAKILLGASTSLILPLKLTEPSSGWSLARGDAALSDILAQADIRVIDHHNLQPTSLNLLQQAVATGKVIVIQAGDGGQINPTHLARSVPLMSGGAIIVGGVDQNNLITDSSNRAGDMQAYYLVAPSTSPYTSLNSTEVAKSNTAAAAAVLIEAAPTLSSQQVVDILLSTATDLGAAGVDNIYGHGLLNIEAALLPLGVTNIGGNNSSGSGAGAFGAIAVAGAVAYALFGRSEQLQKTLIMDQYDRPYQLDLTARVPIAGQASTSSLLGFSRSSQRVASNTQTSILGFQQQSASVTETSNRLRLENRTEQSQNAANIVSLSQTHQYGNMGFTSVLNRSLNEPLGFGQSTSFGSIPTATLYSPYLALSGRGAGWVSSLRSDLSDSKHRQHKLGFALSPQQAKHEGAAQSVVYQNSVYDARGELGIQISFTHEDGALFGGASGGVLSVESASTLSTMVGGKLNLNPNWSLSGAYAIGRTEVKAARGSLLTNFSRLSSAASEIKLSGQSIFSAKDSIQFGIRQPISFTGGAIDLSVPTAVNASNEALFSDETLSLDDLGALQTTYEIRYQRPLSRRSSLSARWLKRQSKVEQQSVNGLSFIYSQQL